MKKSLTNPDTVARPVGTYSQLATVEVGDAVFLYLAGQVALDKEGNLVGPNDFLRQVVQVLDNIKAILEASGATMNDIIKVNTFVTDMAHRSELRGVYPHYFTGTPPVSTLVQVSQLASPDWLIEVEAVAVVAKKEAVS